MMLSIASVEMTFVAGMATKTSNDKDNGNSEVLRFAPG